ncbi:MAG: hypothetical protein HQM10_05380 [Candidatus Riflebacteria bacterium]|nr:hypothetical protein [Candidatus Riflebacteria bacterium]
MKPIRPCIFNGSAEKLPNPFLPLEDGLRLISFLVQTARNFPSLLLAFSAKKGARSASWEIAEFFAQLGLNVFISKNPVPISALSLSLIKRNIPMGVYIDCDKNDNWTIFPIGVNGGPALISSDNTYPLIEKLPFSGVVGETDLIEVYVKSLECLTDLSYITESYIKELVFPFSAVMEKIKENVCFKNLSSDNLKGMTAIVSNDGQILELFLPNGEKVSDETIIKVLANYLIGVRESRGTVFISSKNSEDIKFNGLSIKNAEIQRVGDDTVELAHRSGYSDLLIGCCPPGHFIHQGHTPFGDGLLTLFYLLEAWDWEESNLP